MRRQFLRCLAVAVPAVLLGVLAGAAVPAAAAPALAPAERFEPLRVMPLGDSITWGVGSTYHDGYRQGLYQRLASAGVDVDFVGSMRNGRGPDRDNEGHKGWTIAELGAQVDEWLAAYTPDVILLHIGTNDMVQNLPDAPLQMSGLLDRIAVDRPDAEVFVAQIVGLGNYPGTQNEQLRTDAFNDAVAETVANRGDHFHLVDQTGVHGIDMRNREHPNDYGYATMAWNWYRAMEPVLNPDGARWPATRNPDRAAVSYRCIDLSTLDPAVAGCHQWYHRLVNTNRRGVWQLPVRERLRENGKIVVRLRWVAAA